MNLTKENYEFLMFELLEGNLNETEKNFLLEQINKDAFYQREWTLMQHGVVLPDNMVVMPDKGNMLKTERKIFTFAFMPLMKIAASLIFIGTVSWWYYSTNNATTVVNTPTNNPNHENKITPNPPVSENNLKQISNDNRKAIVSSKKVSHPISSKEKAISSPNSDSIMPTNLPEIFLIKPLEKEAIAYTISPNEVITLEKLNAENPKTITQNKFSQLLSKVEKLRNTVTIFWNDIPNLKLKVTPQLKNRNIGFELKGETIYANAIIEIK